MSETRWAAVDSLFEKSLVHEDAVLESVPDANLRAGLPAYDVTAAQGKFLHLLVQISGARRILEVGTLGGYSTIWLARALPPGGRVVTLELVPEYAAVARENLVRAGVGHLVETRVGDARASLAELVDGDADPFDLVFIDADKQSNPEYLAAAKSLSRPGTLIVVDNVVRDGRVVEPDCDDVDVVGVRRMLDQIHDDPDLSATALQTVGRKGYDGFVLAVVNGS